MLNELQKDLLSELVNVYVGQAASVLSEMVNQKIVLSIPNVELLSTNDFHAADNTVNLLLDKEHLITFSLKFGHEFNGRAILMFPAHEAKILVNTCLGEVITEEDLNSKKLLDTDLDVLTEISNVILNAIIGEFGNLLGLRLEYSLPNVELISVTSNNSSSQPPLLENEVHIIILETIFLFSEANIKGAVLIALSLGSVNALLEAMDKLLEDVYG